MSTIKIETFQHVTIEYALSGVGNRILARLIDFGIIGCYAAVVVFGAARFAEPVFESGSSSAVALSLFFLPAVFYSLLSEVFLQGQTIGKRALKIRVIDIGGSSVNFWQYFLRWVFRIVDNIALSGLILIAVTKKGQRLGDMLAGTTVVDLQIRNRFTDQSFTLPPNYSPTFPQAALLSDRDITVVKEVVMTSKKAGDPHLPIVQKAATKVRQLMGLNYQEPSVEFLETVIMDHFYYTSSLH